MPKLGFVHFVGGDAACVVYVIYESCMCDADASGSVESIRDGNPRSPLRAFRQTTELRMGRRPWGWARDEPWDRLGVQPGRVLES